MEQINAAVVLVGVLVLAGVLAVVLLLLYRKMASSMRSELDAGRALAARQNEEESRLRAQLDQALARCTVLDDQKDEADRERVRFESDVGGLRERLQEMQERLAGRERELQEAGVKLADLDRQFTALQVTHNEKLANFEEIKQSLEQSRLVLKTEFQNLANEILEEKGKTFAQTSQVSLDAMLKPFREQIQGFQQRINQVHDEAVKGNVSLGAEIKQVLAIGMKMSAEASTLTTALKGDKKSTGSWGEVQLERTLQLAGLVKGDHYEPQARFKDDQGNARQPDFVVKLPDQKHMVIDSKVSLIDYDRAIAAETDAEVQAALDAHVRAVRNHIDDLSKKDYTNLIGMRSPSFVLMFMPIEPAYIEALKHNRELFDYGYQRNVILVSHTTLMPILKTVANLWMTARSNEQAYELSTRAGEIYNQVVVVAENLKKLGDTLSSASNHYNHTVTSLAGKQGLYGKTVRFNELSSKANKTMPPLEPLHRDVDTEKLELIVGPEVVRRLEVDEGSDSE